MTGERAWHSLSVGSSQMFLSRSTPTSMYTLILKAKIDSGSMRVYLEEFKKCLVVYISLRLFLLLPRRILPKKE